MKRSYLEELYTYLEELDSHLSDPGNGREYTSLQKTEKPDGLKRFYQLGVKANRSNLSMTDVLNTEEIWKELQSSNDREAIFFASGLHGLDMPDLPDQVTKPERVDSPLPAPDPEPISLPPRHAPKVTEVAQLPITKDLQSTSKNDLEQEVMLLKTLVGLLEKKLAQPVTVELKTPKLISSSDIVQRDNEENISGKKTFYEYEE